MVIRRTVELLKREGPSAAVRKGSKFLRRNVRRALLKALRSEHVMSSYGVYLTRNWGDQTFEFCVFGCYGNNLSEYLLSQTVPFVFIDIGANQGLYSLIAGKNSSCIHVHAFEPVTMTFSLLQKNIIANDLSRRVTAHKFGISTDDAEVPIFMTHNHSGAASLHHHDLNGVVGDVVKIKQAEVIAPLIPPNVNVIVKIDVEGHEHFVVESLARSSFVNRISSVFYEVDERWIDPMILENRLRSIGMTFFEKVGKSPHYDVLARRCVA